MTRLLATLLAVLLVAGVAYADPEETHTGVYETKHYDVKYRPGTRAAAAVERDGALAERDYADICRRLDFTPEGRFTLYLYDDGPELRQISGVQAGAFSSGRFTHVPFGDDQTRYHELVHAIASCLPRTGDEAPSMFLADGLANALLEYVNGVAVRAVAKYYLERAELPALGSLLHGDFYAWQKAHPKMNGYDIAGSFVRFLIDEYGVKKVKRLYTGTTAKKAFGKTVAQLESAWRADLDAYELRPEVRQLLAKRHGHPVPFPPEIAGKPEDWHSLMAADLNSENADQWKRTADAITCIHPGGGPWSVCELGAKKYGNCIVWAKITTKGVGGGVQLRLGNGACAMLVMNGTFIYRNDQPATSNTDKSAPQYGSVELVLVRRGGKVEVWVDGTRQLEADVDATPHPVGLAVHTGTAEFRDVKVRALD